MKKLFTALVFAISCATASILYAQLPATKTLQWDANPPADNVTKYTITVNGVATDVAPVTDPACNCIQHDFVIAQQGTLTLTVTATNEWGTSQPTTLIKQVSVPGSSRNLRIK